MTSYYVNNLPTRLPATQYRTRPAPYSPALCTQAFIPKLPTDTVDPYLTVPKHLFQTPKLQEKAPNDIIDDICKYDEIIYEYLPWIFDLEFGVPKDSVKRPVAVYDVKNNTVFTKNTNLVYPGLTNISSEFRKGLLSYYEQRVTKMFEGYCTLFNDRSVDNFSAWVSKPLQYYGFACWP